MVPSHPRRPRGPRLILPTAVILGLVIGAGLALAGPSAPAASSNAGLVLPDAPATGPATGEPPDELATAPEPIDPVDSPAPTDVRPPSDIVPALSSLTGYRWPLFHGRITLPFGSTPWGTRVVEGQLFHDGVDLATFCGDRIVAAHDGTVLAAGRHFDHALGWLGDLGAYTRRLDRKQLWGTLPIIIVTDDGNGYRSVYAHFGKVVVKRGDKVTAGQLIGYEGRTGRATGCHLHYGLFSPNETSAFRIERAVARRMKLPLEEIARVDPLVVLPPRGTPSD